LLALVEPNKMLKAVSCVGIIPKMPYVAAMLPLPDFLYVMLKRYCLNTKYFSCTILTKHVIFSI